MYTFLYIYTFIYIYMYMYVCRYIYVYMYIYVHTKIYTYMYIQALLMFGVKTWQKPWPSQSLVALLYALVLSPPCVV